MNGKLVRAVIGGFIVAGLVHVIAVLLIPGMASNDATGRVQRAAVAGAVTPIPADGSVLPDLDPFFVHAACPFEGSTPTVVEGPVPDDYWSLAVVSRAGGVVASFDRSAVGAGPANLTVGLPGDIEQIRLQTAGSGVGGLQVEVPPGPGFVLIRASAADPDTRVAVSERLAAFTCGPAGTP
ncbi:DUF1254 domain-containing protein [Chthonobacter albigriseus]|uniref:DUF1254 domain-containing protein n=1 Tax=Chthonobacter albigriseus TaxID=1683161 RepID=UPI0015EEFF7A|nr:hypothetical protein [Chthonobacter albigriseus]